MVCFYSWIGNRMGVIHNVNNNVSADCQSLCIINSSIVAAVGNNHQVISSEVLGEITQEINF